jgi:myosin-crossreactive antigen
MSKITKAQLNELEELLKSLKEYLDDHGAPNSIVSNISDMQKTINWTRKYKSNG